MGTPHSESVEKYQSGESTIRPLGAADAASIERNKADHYGVLAQVIHAGVESYLANDELKARLLEAPSVIRMAPIMAEDVNQSVLDALADPTHLEHFLNLETSQYERYLAGQSRFVETHEAILAGVRNFTNLFQDMFFSLGRFGLERATHKDNWKIAETLSHLNMQQMSAYREVYLANYRNWSQLVDHLQKLPTGGLAFRDGYPGNAPIVIEFKDEKNKPDPTIEPVTVLIKEMAQLNPTVGSPGSFDPIIIEKLWSVYSSAALEIASPRKPKDASSVDGTEASAR